MPANPEQAARENIDRLLTQAGWAVQDIKSTNLHASPGVAIREFPLATGHGCADYLLYVQGKAAGVIEAKAGATLSGVEVQSAKYQCGLPDSLPAWFRPLPFCYQSTGVETHFTNGFDPDPRSRDLFVFHRPDTLASWLQTSPHVVSGSSRDGQEGYGRPATFRRLLKTLPPLIEQGLWAAQIRAIRSLEASLAEDRPRALIQMATGSGKTFTAIYFIYRLIKFAGARRVLFRVDRGNLGRQTKKEFDQYVSPCNNFKFGEEYIVQHLGSNHLDRTARVVIATIQRFYSMLKGRELSEEDEDASVAGLEIFSKSRNP